MDHRPYYVNLDTGEIQRTQTNANRLVAIVDFEDQNEVQRFLHILQDVRSSDYGIGIENAYRLAFKRFANPPVGEEPTDVGSYADDGAFIWIRHPKTQRWTAVGSGMFTSMTWEELNHTRGPVTVRHL